MLHTLSQLLRFLCHDLVKLYIATPVLPVAPLRDLVQHLPGSGLVLDYFITYTLVPRPVHLLVKFLLFSDRLYYRI